MPDTDDPRVRLAAERTLLAWVRTGLALMGFGFVVARFGLFLHELSTVEALPRQHGGWSLYFGTTLVLLGVAVNVMAALSHVRLIDALNRGETILNRRWSSSVILSLLLAAIGGAMAAYLFWVGR